MITPRDFVERWGQSTLREQQAAQSHFNELCELVGHKTPTQLDPEGTFFTFEEQVEKATGGNGRADVWYKAHFAWEYKGKHRDLDEAYAQLLAYRGGLDNPPLLVVCDFLEYRIYPQWTNTSGQPFVFHNADLLDREKLRWITWLLEDPNQFLELRQAEREQREKLTLSLAEKFAHLADLMRNYRPSREDNPHPPTPSPLHGEGSRTEEKAWQPMQIARFLTKLVFALFAEDVELMPTPFDQTVFRYLLMVTEEMPETFAREMGELFQAMDGQRYGFVGKFTPYFNGGMFTVSSPGADDGYEVLDLTLIPGAIDLLREVSEADWRFVNPTIFGTLFEGALDVSKRAQLGAHYTGEDDIRLVVEPVLMQPLYRLWENIRAEAEPTLQAFLAATLPKAKQQTHDALTGLHDRMMTALENTRVLDPACGSGNFLYMSLRAMKDLEARVRKFFEPLGLPFRDVVTPRQLYGIEKDEFAANLAKVVVWIGYLQWRYEDEGVLHPHNPRKQPHPRELPDPIIKDKNSPDEPDRIVCDDAIMRYDVEGKPYEPEWPEVDVIMGNPPFLGSIDFLNLLGENYTESLRSLYFSRLTNNVDLVIYWFEKARSILEKNRDLRVGLVCTSKINQRQNRVVLDRIKQVGDFFLAVREKEWHDGRTAVRVSLVGFDGGKETERTVDGEKVHTIHINLTSGVDITQKKLLLERPCVVAMGTKKYGAFELTAQQAEQMLTNENPSDIPNSLVIRRWANGQDVARGRIKKWIIDFHNGGDRTEEEARQFIMPFEYVEKHVLPERKGQRNERLEREWWLYEAPRHELRESIKGLSRYLVTVYNASRRYFVWLDSDILPDQQLVVFATESDYIMGVLQSVVHELWSLEAGGKLGIGNTPRYTITEIIDTFPFPWSPGQEDTESEAYKAISAAAKQLHEEREAWLNPPPERYIELGITAQTLRERTLTHVYNAVVGFRNPHPPSPSPLHGEGENASRLRKEGEQNGEGNGNGNGRIPKAARNFAPRLAELHDALDKAVCAAYGWDDLFPNLRTAEGDEEVLRRLLALNLGRAGMQG